MFYQDKRRLMRMMVNTEAKISIVEQQITIFGRCIDSSEIGLSVAVEEPIEVDTVVDVLGTPTTVPITSIDIDTILNLPANFTYACEPSSCSFPGGSTACIKIFSTMNPTIGDVGNYLLDIQISAVAGILSQSGNIDYYDIDIIDPNGINEIKNEISLAQNQPNPFNGNTIIKYNSILNTTVKFVVTDLLGKQVFASNYNAVSGKNFIEFNGNNLEKGIYLYSIAEGNNKITKKMVVR